MRPQRDDKVVDAVRGVVGGQDDGLVLPLVLFGVTVTAVFADLWRERVFSTTSCCPWATWMAYLSKLKAAKGLLLLE